jgi:transcriptional regulator GlxA family with amidase domain
MLVSLCEKGLSGDSRPPEIVRPATLRRAEDFIAANLAEPLTMADLAEAANTSARSLQRAFHHYRDMSPVAYIRKRRLEKVHEELLACDPSSASVSQIALQWGFVHLGRFSSQYFKHFNELPSDTLRR